MHRGMCARYGVGMHSHLALKWNLACLSKVLFGEEVDHVVLAPGEWGRALEKLVALAALESFSLRRHRGSRWPLPFFIATARFEHGHTETCARIGAQSYPRNRQQSGGVEEQSRQKSHHGRVSSALFLFFSLRRGFRTSLL